MIKSCGRICPDKFDHFDASNHAAMRPEIAENTAVENIIKIAKETGVHFHIVHVSSAKSMDLSGKAKSECKITCETGPQYLYFDDAKLKEQNGHHFLCTPPFRSQHTKNEMRELAKTGVFDIFATDHCAFKKTDKDFYKGDVMRTPKGLPGIGALAPMIFKLFENAPNKAIRGTGNSII